jgi:hypothetical protein
LSLEVPFDPGMPPHPPVIIDPTYSRISAPRVVCNGLIFMGTYKRPLFFAMGYNSSYSISSIVDLEGLTLSLKSSHIS